MSDFCGRGAVRSMDTTVNHQPATDTCSHRDVENGPMISSCAELCFRQRGTVTVVTQDGRQPQFLPHPVHKCKAIPAVNLMTGADPPVGAVDRTTESDANALNVMRLFQFLRGVTDLLQNSLSARMRDDVVSYERFERCVPTVAKSELQLRATDFDTKKHKEP